MKYSSKTTTGFWSVSYSKKCRWSGDSSSVPYEICEAMLAGFERESTQKHVEAEVSME